MAAGVTAYVKHADTLGCTELAGGTAAWCVMPVATGRAGPARPERPCLGVAQFAGAISAALFLQAMFTHVAAGGNYPIATPGGDWRSLVMETVLTAILVSVILNTATGGRSIGHNAAIAVGSTVALLGLFASPISGASMNPARTLGPDIVGNDYTGWWIYIVGPVVGAAIAVAIIGTVRGLPDKEEREAAQGTALPILGSPRAPEIKEAP
jgi:aquaporin Z